MCPVRRSGYCWGRSPARGCHSRSFACFCSNLHRLAVREKKRKEQISALCFRRPQSQGTHWDWSRQSDPILDARLRPVSHPMLPRQRALWVKACVRPDAPISALSQSRRFDLLSVTSALPRTSDVSGRGRHFAFVPLADIAPTGRGIGTRIPLPKCTVSLPWRPARSSLRA